MIDIYKFLKNTIKIELMRNDNKGQPVLYKTEIVSVCDDKILVKMPQADNKDFSKEISEYDCFNAVIYTDEGILSSNINFLGLVLDGTNNIYLSFPYNNHFCQRRENSRTPMHIDFELEIINSENNVLSKFDLKSKNISGKGIACITESPLMAFDKAKILLHFKDITITAFCRKVYSNTLLLNEKVLYVNGIEFTEISPDDVKLIMKKCLQFEISAKHNERLFETI